MTKLAFLAAATAEAQAARKALVQAYGGAKPAEADVIVPLGGDGFMLETMHRLADLDKPFYGMNQGTVGFLLNRFRDVALPDRLAAAERVDLHPLRMKAEDRDGKEHHAIAFNEVSILRRTRQAARIRIHVDGKERLSALVCDGVLLSTAAGSTAYNLSAHGPILPMGSNVLALTPISAFRPRRWRGAVLPHAASVTFEILEAEKRPVNAVADFTEVRRVLRVHVHEDRETAVTLLFDPEHNLEERILAEQFVP